MPLLFDPEFTGRKRDEITGKTAQIFKLKNLDVLGIAYSVEYLPFGDYIFPLMIDDKRMITVIRERKTVSDLISSLTGVHGKGKIRIDDQVVKCFEGGKEYYGEDFRVDLLIEDYYECRFDFTNEGWGVWVPYRINYSTKKMDKEGRAVYSNAWYSRRLIHPSALLGKIASIESNGVNVIRCGGAQHAYKMLIDELTGTRKKETTTPRAIRNKPSEASMTPSEEIEFFLQGLPGIGGKISKDLLSKYPVLIDLLNKIVTASVAKDVGVRGYGPVALESNKRVLTGTWTPEAGSECESLLESIDTNRNDDVDDNAP